MLAGYPTLWVIACLLGGFVFPILYLSAYLLLKRSKISQPPYFAYHWLFVCSEILCLSLILGNTPAMVLAGWFTFLFSPLLLLRNLRRIAKAEPQTTFHRTARWASYAFFVTIFGLLIIGLLTTHSH